MKKVIAVIVTIGLLGVVPISSANAGCSNNIGHCSVKYPSKSKKMCSPSCFKGTNTGRKAWGY